MKIAINSSFDERIPFDRAIPMIREAGFDVVSLGPNPGYSGYVTTPGRAALRNLLLKHGMALDSIHAPWSGDGPLLFSLDENQRREGMRQCEMAMDAAADLDGKILVIHLLYGTLPHGQLPGGVRNKMIERGRASVGALADYAAGRGVKLALENGEDPYYDMVLADFMSEFDDARVGFCYDAGHENLLGRCFRLLEQYGRRLLTVHIHDNEGTDAHTLPFEGAIDWDRFRKIFHALGYSGNLHLEADIKNSRFKDPVVFLTEARTRGLKLLEPAAG